MSATNDTIHAIATPPGVGGVGVVRISGPEALAIAQAVTGKPLEPRIAHFCRFLDADQTAIDSGLAIYFSGPASFTGEDVVELQGHGGDVVQQMLSRRLHELGSRQARPGEFSERAFLNDKMDLAQAEAVADLVVSGTESAARAAQRSLEGELSHKVEGIQASLTSLRVFIEAALDFPDEEIDFIAESDVTQRLDACLAELERVLDQAKQGRVLRDGITVAIIGQPNAGKSSLLNALAGRESAIVTDIPGTTRDVLRETLSLDGLPVHIADTAGIREATDQVEAEGIRRAQQAIEVADIALLVLDPTGDIDAQLSLAERVPDSVVLLKVLNKIDLDEGGAGEGPGRETVRISASQGTGLDTLVAAIRRHAGLAGSGESTFSARTRHVEALNRTREHLVQGRAQLLELSSAETLAEELRLAQRELGEITGEFLPDDLLGAIFSSFCIGK